MKGNRTLRSERAGGSSARRLCCWVAEVSPRYGLYGNRTRCRLSAVSLVFGLNQTIMGKISEENQDLYIFFFNQKLQKKSTSYPCGRSGCCIACHVCPKRAPVCNFCLAQISLPGFSVTLFSMPSSSFSTSSSSKLLSDNLYLVPTCCLSVLTQAVFELGIFSW